MFAVLLGKAPLNPRETTARQCHSLVPYVQPPFDELWGGRARDLRTAARRGVPATPYRETICAACQDDKSIVRREPKVQRVRFCALALSLIPFGIAAARALPDGPRVISSAYQAHSLSVEESKRGLPVHFRATVTYYDPYLDSRRGVLFVCDRTGCVFVSVPSRPVLPIRSGTEIDIEGVSGPGDFAPIVDRPQIRVTGSHRRLPEARRVGASQMYTGTYDCAWVEIEGLVRGVHEFDRNVAFDIDNGGSLVGAVTVREPGADYGRLLDAEIRIRGHAAPRYLGNRVTVGGLIFFQSLAQVAIVEAGPPDPFALRRGSRRRRVAVFARSHLSSPGPRAGPRALSWPGQTLCIEDPERRVMRSDRSVVEARDGRYGRCGGVPVEWGLKGAG